MAENFPPREVSALVSLFQRAHNKIVALQKLDDQLALLAEQHRRLQEEVRSIRGEINEEFERALRSNQAPSKLAAALAQPIEGAQDSKPPEDAGAVEVNENIAMPS